MTPVPKLSLGGVYRKGAKTEFPEEFLITLTNGAETTEIERVLDREGHTFSRRADGGERAAAGARQVAGDSWCVVKNDQKRSVKPEATVTSFRVFESLPSKGLNRET